MKKLILSAAVIASMLAASCSDDDDNIVTDSTDGDSTQEEPETPETETVTGIMTEDKTLTNDRIWIIEKKLVVGEGVTLTIDPGSIIKGKYAREANASALVVDQGGTLIAEGTAEEPIIFTSELDDIELGQIAGSNLTIEDNGLWGGLIVLGNAPISVDGDAGTAQIEGIPSTETYGQYGGDDPEDNSGIIKYVSIRHGGITIGQDNEINGLTMGGVGSGTTIDYVEVVANQDDAFEWFGGTTDSSNLLAWAQGDDGLDIDQAYNGTITNAAVVLTGNSGSGLEIDGPEGGEDDQDLDLSGFTIDGLTLIDVEKGGFYTDLRDGALGEIKNAVFSGSGDSEDTFRFDEQDSQDNFENDLIKFSNIEVVLPSGASLEDMLLDAPAGSESKFTDNATALDALTDATTGADLDVFADWTYASSQDAL